MKRIRKCTAFLIATIMMASNIAPAFASTPSLDSPPSEIINSKTPVKVAKPAEGKTANDLIKKPDQPDIYTLRTDYKVQRGEKYEINYQPYIASVGAGASDEEKAKVKQEITLPDIAGYDKSQLEDSYTIDYKTIVDKAKDNNKTGNAEIGIKHEASQDFKYKAKKNTIKIKHVFQTLEDFSKYTNKDGTEDEDHAHYTSQEGNTGSTMEVSPLQAKDIEGFTPERASITMQVPENAKNFILEYRYNRKHYDVTFDSAGGTALPSRTLYYEQTVPKIDDTLIPKKEGCDFLGWKPSINLTTEDNRTFDAGQIIKDGNGKPILNLDAEIKMPAKKITFTAVWKNKKKADYAIQFWAEKSDHADDASLLEKYDYMGARVYKEADTGVRPNLDTVSIDKIPFPDLDKDRLAKIWNGDRFYRDQHLYLNKFYVYNKDLTHAQNKDPKDVRLVKSVEATGKTVYNIYYDRQVYDLYFTQSNYYAKTEPEKTFYPEIWGLDKNNKQVKLGGPGDPYHFKARFNQLMLDWPNDAMQVKGFTRGSNSRGWSPNTTERWWSYRDTPPYRLTAEQFLDFAEYDNKGGYTKKIDAGEGKIIEVKDFKTLSFGIEQYHDSIPHHMDFWMDGFKDGETIIRYDLYRSKADTESKEYGHKYTVVKGFTPYNYTGNDYSNLPTERMQPVNENEIFEIDDERDRITPFPKKKYKDIYGFEHTLGQIVFMQAFFNDADSYGDPDESLGIEEFKTNGYLRFKYKRNKYPLRFNYDPSKIKDDSEFGQTNSLETYYDFPLKVLSPDLVPNETPREKREYFKDNPANFLDNPENLQKLGLTDLIFNDPNDDNKLKVRRPDNLSDQMVFKGWALDPAGTKLIWENKDEKMPDHALNLYAKWGEPDFKWKVTFDPNGGKLKTIKEENLTTERKMIQEGDIGQEEVNTYPKKEESDGNKQVFTVIHRQKLVEPGFKPERKGYDFMGWEVIRYKKNEKGDYTEDQVDNTYRETYSVPELYSFGNDVVAPVYLKAIWVPNQRVDVKVEHYMLDKDYKLVKKHKDTLEDKRAGYLVAATGDRQDEKYILATQEEINEKLKDYTEDGKEYKLKTEYDEYNARVKGDNSFFQTFRVEPAKIPDPKDSSKPIDNPKVEDNVFKFFYRPFRKREYKVNYIDERFKGKENQPGAAIIEQEKVENGNRHYDARNYRPIPGWVLTSDPQQQLFFDVDEDTNEFKGINGTGKDEITFYYKDVRVIEIPTPKEGEKIPEPANGYVRVTFKADKGGDFGKDKNGKPIKELHYDVIKGLKSDLLPVPGDPTEDDKKEADKYYISPDTGKKFTKWDDKPLLNKNTIVNNEEKDFYVFTAKFEWSGLTASGLVRTEAYKDPNGTWTNDFAPTIDQLKKQLVWKEKDVEKPLPAGTKIQLFDEKGNELTEDKQVFDLVNEKKAADKDELVRTVNITAKVTFKDVKDPQELDIPITVYKNVYEALNKKGDKPLFLKEAEGKEAKDGGLKEILKDNKENRYIKVTVKPNRDFDNKDDKIYYVNPNAWVEIPEVKPDGSSTFVNWTADQVGQNENGKENGKFDFTKRHKFTEDTVITPVGAKDVVEQEKGKDKPDVPDSYVKVIVKTTDKATDQTAFEKTFWVNPSREVSITLANLEGKTNQEVDIPLLGKKKVNYVFKEWQKVQAGEADDKLAEVKPPVKIDLAKNKYTDKVTVIEAVYNERFAATPIVKPIKTEELHTPEGKDITDKDLIEKITPPENKEIESITVVERPDPSKPGKQEAKVTIKYKDGSTQGTNDKPVVIPVEVHKNIIPEVTPGKKPEGAMDNYVKVTFKAGTGGSVSGDLVYYVSPEVEVDMTDPAKAVTKTPSVGYYVNGENWTNKDNKALKGTFADPETEFVFNFVKYKDIVEKTNDPKQVIPEGYVKVTFKAEEEGSKGKLINKEGNQVVERVFYVNPKAEIKLVKLADGQAATDKQLAVPKTKPAEHYEDDKWYEEIDTENPITSTRIHVAKFKPAKVTLTYDAGGATTGTVPASMTVDHGTRVGLANPGSLAKDNSSFAGWKLDGDETIYKPGAQVKLERARTAIAQWTTNGYTVRFNSMGGSDVSSQTVAHGDKAINPDAPTLDGKVFMGWKENENDKNYFDFSTPITADKTLIAIWKEPVQKIGENDEVEDQFIKVTFLKGNHGTLYDNQNPEFDKITYKVAKDYTFEEALQNGMVVPGIKANKYYKIKADENGQLINGGWDNEEKLNGRNIVFTAQYEPIADVIPVGPAVTPDDKLQEDKPEGMVLVEFKVPEDKAFMTGDSKFYVKANTEVEIDTPVVHKLTLADDMVNDYEFKSWDLTTGNNDKWTFEDGKWKFEEDTIIGEKEKDKPDIKIKKLKLNANNIIIDVLTEGATGYLEITGDGIIGNKTIESTKRGRRYFFNINKEIGRGLKRGDKIKIYAIKDGIKSEEREYEVR